MGAGVMARFHTVHKALLAATERRGGLTGCLLALLLGAGALRVLALLSIKQTVYFDYLLWDEHLYHRLAVKMVEGSRGSSSLYGNVVAVLYRVFSEEAVYIRALNVVVGVLTCSLLFLLGRRLVSARVGLAACLLAALYGPFIFYSVVPLKTALSVFFFALAVYMLLCLIDDERRSISLLLGVCMGLAVNLRPNLLLLAAVIPLWLLLEARRQRPGLRRRAGSMMLYLLGLGLSLGALPAANRLIQGTDRDTGKIGAVQAGMNFYLGNNLDNPVPYFGPARFASTVPREQPIHFTIEASRRKGERLDPRQASRFWIGQVFRDAAARPLAFAHKLLLKTAAVFNAFEGGDHYHIGFMGRFAPFLRWPWLPFWLLMPLGMAGMAVEVLHSRKARAMAVAFFCYVLTLVAFFTNTRYRLVLLTVLIPLAVAGMARMAGAVRARERRTVLIYVSALAIFAGIEFLPLPGAGDMSPYLNTHGVALASRGKRTEALEYWRRSSRSRYYFAEFARLALASHYGKAGDLDTARFYLDRIDDDSFAAAYKQELLGDIAVLQGRPPEAIEAYRRSLDIHSGQREARKKLIRALRTLDPREAEQEQRKLQYIRSFYPR